MSFDDDLNAPFEKDWSDVDVLLNGTLYTFRFTALDAHVWADACDRAPVRADVTFDQTYGYDIREMTLSLAPLCGLRRVGDFFEELSADQWRVLLERIDGHTFNRIGEVLWALNEALPAEAVAGAKKALAAGAAISSSQSDLVSPRKGSGVGSRKKSTVTSTTTPVESPAL